MTPSGRFVKNSQWKKMAPRSRHLTSDCKSAIVVQKRMSERFINNLYLWHGCVRASARFSGRCAFLATERTFLSQPRQTIGEYGTRICLLYTDGRHSVRVACISRSCSLKSMTSERRERNGTVRLRLCVHEEFWKPSRYLIFHVPFLLYQRPI
jgi:hypothetical protein